MVSVYVDALKADLGADDDRAVVEESPRSDDRITGECNIEGFGD